MKIFNIRIGINPAFWLQQVSIFRKKRIRHDSPLVLLLFEMRIRKKEENRRQLSLFEEIGQVLHCVCSDAAEIREVF